MSMKLYEKIKNFGRVLHYTSERYFNRPLPKCIANKIAKHNINEYKKINDGRLILDTYDGSGQIVHPDFIKWHDKLWLVCTPYPYGYNKCENPSIYVGDDIESLKQACKNPIDFPSSKAKGSILSDPCFFTKDNKLCVCYRERIQEKNNAHYLLHVKSSADGSLWSDKITIKSTEESDKDTLISPAIIEHDGKYYMYHVKAKGYGGDVILSELDDELNVREIKPLKCIGLDENLLIWHIGVHSQSYKKSSAAGEKIFALLYARNKTEGRVYKAYQESPESDWIIEKEVLVPDDVKYRVLYKSSYTPDGKIALSYFDIKNRVAVKIIEDL